IGYVLDLFKAENRNNKTMTGESVVMKKKIAGIFTVFLASLMLAGCGNSPAADTDNGSGEDVFKVGMEAAYAPFNWTQMDDSNDAAVIQENEEFAGGYDVEIAKRIAEGLGKELVIVKTEWDGLIPSLD